MHCPLILNRFDDDEGLIGVFLDLWFGFDFGGIGEDKVLINVFLSFRFGDILVDLLKTIVGFT